MENRLSRNTKDSKKRFGNNENKTKTQDKEKRRQEMEKRKEERRKEMERRRLERERQKTERTKLSSPKRIPETSVIPDEGSDHEDFEPWEDVEETQNSPRSDVTVSTVGFRVKVLPAVKTRNSGFWVTWPCISNQKR